MTNKDEDSKDNIMLFNQIIITIIIIIIIKKIMIMIVIILRQGAFSQKWFSECVISKLSLNRF